MKGVLLLTVRSSHQYKKRSRPENMELSHTYTHMAFYSSLPSTLYTRKVTKQAVVTKNTIHKYQISRFPVRQNQVEFQGEKTDRHGNWLGENFEKKSLGSMAIPAHTHPTPLARPRDDFQMLTSVNLSLRLWAVAYATSLLGSMAWWTVSSLTSTTIREYTGLGNF